MARETLNNGEPAKLFREKLNDNFIDLYENKARLNHTSNDTSFGAASATLFGHVRVPSANGLNVVGGVLSISKATTSQAGAVQLVNSATSSDTDKAATAGALKGVADSAVKTYWGTGTPTAGTGKTGDIYFKTL